MPSPIPSRSGRRLALPPAARLLALGALALAAPAPGCGSSHGPEPDGDAGPAPAGSPCSPLRVPPGGFVRTEAYVEFGSADCGGGACVVYKLDGDPTPGCAADCADPGEAARRMFCTLRCDGPPESGPYPGCPAGLRCEPLLELGPSPGSYCVRDGL